MKIILIYNATSGSEYSLPKLRRLFKQNRITIDYSFNVKQLASKKLKTLINQGVIVAAVGGDGTLNSVARLVVHSPSTLLPLAGGTFNHFIRDLGMSARLDETLANIAAAKTKLIDVAYVNDELFLNNSNLGLYPFSLIERKQTKKLLGKWVAAGLSVIDQLSLFRRHSLIIDGQKIKSPFVFVGNNVYDIKQSMIPQRTNLSQGILSVIVASSTTRRELLGVDGAVVRGDVSRRDDVSITQRKELSIYSNRSTIPVSFDGELKRLAPPLSYRIDSKCLRVMVVKAD